uniref:Uncharacterized protein n=1 Tax=Anguilla anguilla TaxID=7936 RepID=A0A0E9SMT3_ANGAN
MESLFKPRIRPLSAAACLHCFAYFTATGQNCVDQRIIALITAQMGIGYRLPVG